MPNVCDLYSLSYYESKNGEKRSALNERMISINIDADRLNRILIQGASDITSFIFFKKFKELQSRNDIQSFKLEHLEIQTFQNLNQRFQCIEYTNRYL